MAEVWQSTIVDGAGNIIPRAVVEVKIAGAETLATIYEDQGGLTPLRNPFFADDDGFARFYADAGLYRIRARRGSLERVYENVMIGETTATYYVWQHQVADSQGNVLPMAAVEIRDADTSALATLYVDEDGAVALANPFTADSDGVARCYVASGVYRIEITRGASFEMTYEDVVIGPAPDLDLYAWQSLIVDDVGDVQPGASVLVTEQDSSFGDPATIYADDAFTPLDNPFESDASGFARFYIAAGRYQVRVRSHCMQRVLRDVRIGVERSRVIVGSIVAGEIMYSDDGGETYQLGPNTLGAAIHGLCYSDDLGLFVALTGGAQSVQVQTSPDGLTWTAHSGPWSIPIREGGICWSSDLQLFVIVASDSTGGNLIPVDERAATSPDAVNWTIRTTPDPGTFYPWHKVEWHPSQGVFFATSNSGTGGLGNNMMSSPDGITWTIRTNPGNQIPYKSASNSEYIVTSDTALHQIHYTEDMVLWTDVGLPGSALGAVHIEYSPTLGLFVAGRSDAIFYASSPGVWTRVSLPSGFNYDWGCWNDVAERFHVVSHSGTNTTRAIWSDDGINWHQATTPDQNILWRSIVAGRP